MEEKLVKETKKTIEEILENGIQSSDLEYLDKLVDIYKDIKEVECMNYGNYGAYNGRGPGHGSYGNYNNYGENYGRRGYDAKYRGHEYIDRMSGEYGRYMENRDRYGASEETDKSFHYMVEALKDFTKVLFEEAETPQQKQMLREAIQQSMM